MENRILSNEYRRVLELGDMTNTPKVMSLDITNKCNFRCKHCFNSSGDDSVYCFKDELTDEEVIKFSKELCEFGLSQICICGGEPTLRIDLVYKVIEMLKKRDIDVNMVSNGYLITRDISQKLKKSGINSVQISVDGLGEIHDKFRNMPGAYKHAIAAINYLYENQIEVMVSCCPNQYNYLGLEMYFEYIYSGKEFKAPEFNPDRKNDIAKLPIKNKKVTLTGLSLGGIVMLPIRKEKKTPRNKKEELARKRLIQAAKNGDEDAIESLTIEDIDTYNELSNRVMKEDSRFDIYAMWSRV